MLIPSNVYQQFGTKVYSCKANQLTISQNRRRIKLHEELNSQKNILIEGDSSQVHPAWIKQKNLENRCERLVKIIFKVQ